jgi:hypothetical protein
MSCHDRSLTNYGTFIILFDGVWHLFGIASPNKLKLKYSLTRGSAVSTMTGYGLDDRAIPVRVPVQSRIFTSPYLLDRVWGFTKPPAQWLSSVLSLGVKRQGREADRSPPTRAEVKKTWTYTSTAPYVFMT